MSLPGDADLRRGLRSAGLSAKVIDAAWPAWSTDDVAESPSARAELRFALARRLGLSPKALLEDRVQFVWKNTARFKHLGTEDANAQAALTSFGMTLGRLLLSGVPEWHPLNDLTAGDLRRTLLADGKPFVGLPELVSFAWAVGIPVVQLRVFPLQQKSMHAMVVRLDGRHVVLLGHAANYPAQTAFTLAHEIGHAVLGHLDHADAVVDLKDPALSVDGDDEETAADRFALEVLTGSPDPQIATEFTSYNAPTLAKAALDAGAAVAIEPGTIVLCLGHRTREWPKVTSALRFIYDGPVAVADYVNGVADSQIDWSLPADGGVDYLRRVLGLPDGPGPDADDGGG